MHYKLAAPLVFTLPAIRKNYGKFGIKTLKREIINYIIYTMIEKIIRVTKVLRRTVVGD